MMPRHSLRSIPLAAALIVLAGAPRGAADPPKVQRLRVQQVGDTTYFHLLLAQPADLAVPQLGNDNLLALDRGVPTPDPSRLPRLVPQSDRATAVYYRIPADALPGRTAPFTKATAGGAVTVMRRVAGPAARGRPRRRCAGVCRQGDRQRSGRVPVAVSEAAGREGGVEGTQDAAHRRGTARAAAGLGRGADRAGFRVGPDGGGTGARQLRARPGTRSHATTWKDYGRLRRPYIRAARRAHAGVRLLQPGPRLHGPQIQGRRSGRCVAP